MIQLFVVGLTLNRTGQIISPEIPLESSEENESLAVENVKEHVKQYFGRK